jgi:hypothetical protein
MIPAPALSFAGRYELIGKPAKVQQAVALMQQDAQRQNIPFHAMTKSLSLAEETHIPQEGVTTRWYSLPELDRHLGPMDFVTLDASVKEQLDLQERSDGQWIYQKQLEKPYLLGNQTVEVFTAEDAQHVQTHRIPYTVHRANLLRNIRNIEYFWKEHWTQFQEKMAAMSTQFAQEPDKLALAKTLLTEQQEKIQETLNFLIKAFFINPAYPPLYKFAEYLTDTRKVDGSYGGWSHRYPLDPEPILTEFGETQASGFSPDGLIRNVDRISY